MVIGPSTFFHAYSWKSSGHRGDLYNVVNMLLSLLTVQLLTMQLVVSGAEFKKHVQNSVYPYDLDPPTYNIESWAKQLHLQQCAFVEVGDKYYAIFVETRPRRYDREHEIREYFLGLCDSDTLFKWAICSADLQIKRATDCTLDQEKMYGARVHRRFCDVTLIAQNAPQCNCDSEVSDSKLYRVQGFPTCFKAPMPDSLCGDNNVCGLASCTPQTINKRVYSARCDRRCRHQQPFCEPTGKETSEPRCIRSFWTDWSNPYCTDVSCVSQFDEAMCINKDTGNGDIDCLGPGTNCCTTDLQNCRCHVYEEDGVSKVFRTFSISQPELIEYMSEEDFINNLPLRYLSKEEYHKYPFTQRDVRSNFGQTLKKSIYDIYERRPIKFGNTHRIHTHPLKAAKHSLLKKTSKNRNLPTVGRREHKRSGQDLKRSKRRNSRNCGSKTFENAQPIDEQTENSAFQTKPNCFTELKTNDPDEETEQLSQSFADYANNNSNDCNDTTDKTSLQINDMLDGTTDTSKSSLRVEVPAMVNVSKSNNIADVRADDFEDSLNLEDLLEEAERASGGQENENEADTNMYGLVGAGEDMPNDVESHPMQTTVDVEDEDANTVDPLPSADGRFEKNAPKRTIVHEHMAEDEDEVEQTVNEIIPISYEKNTIGPTSEEDEDEKISEKISISLTNASSFCENKRKANYEDVVDDDEDDDDDLKDDILIEYDDQTSTTAVIITTTAETDVTATTIGKTTQNVASRLLHSLDNEGISIAPNCLLFYYFILCNLVYYYNVL